MSDRAEALEMAERCEKAAGPDRDIDWDIEEAVGEWKNLGGARKQHKTSGEVKSGYIEPQGAYTAIIDAALTLVPEGWDSIEIRRTDDGEWHVGLAGNDMHLMAEDPDEFYVEAASCKSAALALAAAALRATAKDAE